MSKSVSGQSQSQQQQQQNIALEDLSVEQLSQVKQQLDEVSYLDPRLKCKQTV